MPSTDFDALFDSYARAISANAELAQRAVGELVASAAIMDESDFIEAYRAVVSQFGTFNAETAAEFYDLVRAEAGVSTSYEASPERVDDALLDSDANAVRRAQLAARAARRVMEYADNTIRGNAARDPSEPRWAFIPHAGACGWCRLMGSQGYVYKSDTTASAARHDHCRCTVAPRWSSSQVPSGYDPTALQSQYTAARNAVEADARAEWDAMSAEEQAKYKATGRGAYDHFLRNRIVWQMTKGE